MASCVTLKRSDVYFSNHVWSHSLAREQEKDVMKMRIYKKRKARYAQECSLMAKRGEEANENWLTSLSLYVEANHWYCHKAKDRES